jgi:hypothetical protein
MSGKYILVLAPNINNEADLWDFNPFGNMTLKEILAEVEKSINEACQGTAFSPNYEYYIPFHYFVASQNAKELDKEKRKDIAEMVHNTLIDCNILDRTKFPTRAKNANTIIQWFSSSDTKYKKVLYLKDENVQEYVDELFVPKFPVQNDLILIMLLTYDSFGPNVQKLMDYYPRKW